MHWRLRVTRGRRAGRKLARRSLPRVALRGPRAGPRHPAARPVRRHRAAVLDGDARPLRPRGRGDPHDRPSRVPPSARDTADARAARLAARAVSAPTWPASSCSPATRWTDFGYERQELRPSAVRPARRRRAVVPLAGPPGAAPRRPRRSNADDSGARRRRSGRAAPVGLEAIGQRTHRQDVEAAGVAKPGRSPTDRLEPAQRAVGRGRDVVGVEPEVEQRPLRAPRGASGRPGGAPTARRGRGGRGSPARTGRSGARSTRRWGGGRARRPIGPAGAAGRRGGRRGRRARRSPRPGPTAVADEPVPAAAGRRARWRCGGTRTTAARARRRRRRLGTRRGRSRTRPRRSPSSAIRCENEWQPISWGTRQPPDGGDDVAAVVRRGLGERRARVDVEPVAGQPGVRRAARSRGAAGRRPRRTGRGTGGRRSPTWPRCRGGRRRSRISVDDRPLRRRSRGRRHRRGGGTRPTPARCRWTRRPRRVHRRRRCTLTPRHRSAAAGPPLEQVAELPGDVVER